MSKAANAKLLDRCGAASLPVHATRCRLSRVFPLALTALASALLLVSLKLPLWQMRLEAPQYRDREALNIAVHPNALRGDLRVLKRGGQCFVWLAQIGRKFRMVIAALVGLVSPKRAAVIRAPGLSLRQPGNITPANSFCAGLGLSVSCLTCMGGAILYPLLIFVGTSTWYWGALILGTYSLALAVPMAAIAVAVGNWTWQFVHRPWLTRGLQWTSATVMILVAVLIAFDRTRVINSVVFTLLTALGGNPEPTLAKL